MRTVAWVVGLCFGIALTALGVVAVGAGHGCYVLLGLVSAPLGLLGIVHAVLLAPLFWLFAGLLAGCSASKKAALAFLLLMGVHLAGAVVALSVGPYADWTYLPRTAIVTVTGVLVYAVAHYYVWRVFFYTRAFAGKRQLKSRCQRVARDMR